MNYAIFKFKVEDYDQWKLGFDNNKPARKEAAIKEAQILQNMNVPNEVVILFQVADVAKAKKFSTSADIKEKMKEAGVIGPPEIIFLTEK